MPGGELLWLVRLSHQEAHCMGQEAKMSEAAHLNSERRDDLIIAVERACHSVGR
jgi:hypothetical protein